jgi:hypothetical protein
MIRNRDVSEERNCIHSPVVSDVVYAGKPIPCAPSKRRRDFLKNRELVVLHWLVLLCYANFSILLPYYRIVDTGYRRPGAMVKGCEKKSCCTSQCYLDQHGVHHCVHEPGDSCNCGMSTGEVSKAASFHRELILPETGGLNPSLTATTCCVQAPSFLPYPYLSIPKPPPRLFPA